MSQTLSVINTAIQRRFSRRKKYVPQKRYRINHWIKVPEVMVIDENGENIGVMKTSDAIARATELDLDLIEVSPIGNPPVCRIMELGKWQYQQSQKQKKQKILDTKNVRISFKIGEHDRQVRMSQTKKFLDKGHKVKIEMRLKGREKAYPQQGREKMKQFIVDLGMNLAEEQPVSLQGMSVSALISKKN